MNARLATTENHFSPVGPAIEKLTMFKVTEGIDAEHALEKASNLLEIIVASIDDAAMGTTKLEGHHAWLALHAAESTKAIIDALWNTLQLADAGGAQ
jgi:hypothetical protein